ncbi:helix-turn-helix domain-containing protein, partial [Pseudomonas aeruginosa]
MSEVADDLAEIASLVRELRKRKGITLQALADGIRRSVGFVSQVERGLSRPAVDDLVAISQVLGVPATYFFCSPKTQASPWVTRPGERRTLAYARGASDNLVSPRLGGAFFMLETCLEAGADSGERDLLDSSEQGGYVLEGELTLWLEDEELRLQAGDG